MQVITNLEGAVTVVKPMGPLIADELAELDGSLQELANKWARCVVLNLAEVTFVDSAALELLSRYHSQMSEHGLKIKFCNLTEITRKIFEITRLERRFEIYSDLSRAVRSFI